MTTTTSVTHCLAELEDLFVCQRHRSIISHLFCRCCQHALQDCRILCPGRRLCTTISGQNQAGKMRNERKWSAYGRSAGMKLAQLGVQSPLLFFPRTILTLLKQKVIRSMRRVGLLQCTQPA